MRKPFKSISLMALQKGTRVDSYWLVATLVILCSLLLPSKYLFAQSTSPATLTQISETSQFPSVAYPSLPSKPTIVSQLWEMPQKSHNSPSSPNLQSTLTSQPSELSQTVQSIEQRIQHIINTSAAPNAIWSVSVRDVTGLEIVSLNSNTLLRPASNLKLLTSAAIMNVFGPDHRFETPIYGDGELIDNTWYGNLFVIGVADPSMDGKLYEEDRLFVFKSFLAQLRQAGIHQIKGSLYGDISIFGDEPYPGGWEWDDLSFYYAPEISALAFNGNCVDLEVRADGKIGEKPSITWFPFETPYVKFINEQAITPRGTRYIESYRRLPGSNEILLRSTMPEGYFEEECLSVPNASMFFMDTFARFLQSEGVSIEESVELLSMPVDTSRMTLLAKHTSKPLHEIMNIVNKDSDNLYTEMLMRAAQHRKTGSRAMHNESVAMVRDYATIKGFKPANVYMKDGSGLASFNLLTTSEMSFFLYNMAREPFFDAYKGSFSIAGIAGNFRNRFGRTPLIGNIQGKSGFISGVRAISGYINTEKNNTLIFSIITNNYPTRTLPIDQAHQAILQQLYETL